MSEPSQLNGHVDHDTPWGMQLAVRYDKADPAGHFASCIAAARAVVLLLDHANSQPGGAWHDRVEFWRDGRIRKLVRRARGKRWDDVQRLPGVTATHDRAAVRAFVPGPVRPLPPELDKLQVAGTELPHEDTPPNPAQAPVTILISPLITMTTGKACAQCGHAAQLAYEAMNPAERDHWRSTGFALAIATPTPDQWRATPGRVQVIDAGFTELDGPTETTRALW